MSKFKYALVLFLIALFGRVIYSLCLDNKRIDGFDSVIYCQIAYNLEVGNGYSKAEFAPYEKFYFREPGNVVLTAAAFRLARIFGIVPSYIKLDEFDANNGLLAEEHQELVFVRVLFSLVSSLSVVLIFLIFSAYLPNKRSFLLALTYALFFPIYRYDVSIMREPLENLLLLAINYFFILYLKGDKNYLRLILMGFLLGLEILVFQAMAIFGLFIAGALLVSNRSKLIKAVREISLVAAIALVTILPYSLHIYNYYPDIRIFKTLGVSSFTMELASMSSTYSAVQLYDTNNDIPEIKDFGSNLWWQENSREQYQMSFDGSLAKAQSEIYSKLVKLPTYTLKARSVLFVKSFIVNVVAFFTPTCLTKDVFSGGSVFQKVQRYMLYFLVGFISFLALVKYLPSMKGVYLVLSCFFFLILFYSGFANEPRRCSITDWLIIPLSFLFVYEKVRYYLCGIVDEKDKCNS